MYLGVFLGFFLIRRYLITSAYPHSCIYLIGHERHVNQLKKKKKPSNCCQGLLRHCIPLEPAFQKFPCSLKEMWKKLIVTVGGGNV